MVSFITNIPYVMHCCGEQRMTIAQTNVWFVKIKAKQNSNQTTAN